MSKVRCNLSEEWAREILNNFGDELTEGEEERARRLFHAHLFYTAEEGKRNVRRCQCESCGRNFEVTRESDRAFFEKKHGNQGKCPRCGGSVELVCVGRMRKGKNLTEEKDVLLIHNGEDRALKLTAGTVIREYEIQWEHDGWNGEATVNIQPVLGFFRRRRYYMNQGELGCWEYIWQYEAGKNGWTKRACAANAFQPGPYGYTPGRNGQGYAIGLEHIQNSWAKYSQAIEYIYGHEDPAETEQEYGLEQYLAAYTVYPQLEFAVKMGEEQAVTDLVFKGKKNHRVIDWTAKSPAGFYRMDKESYRKYRAAEGTTEDLIAARELRIPVTDAIQARKVAGKEGRKILAQRAKQAGIRMGQALKYIQKQGGNPDRMIRIWDDYMAMAEALEYDMGSREITTPKNLTQAHDLAAKLNRSQKQEIEEKWYKRRRSKLKKRYAMEWGGMIIKIPEWSGEIVAEGQALSHCVAGYAKRHIDGKTTILFLRRAEEPETPLVTIEMAEDGKTMRQIHGWHNETKKINGEYPESPRETYKEFLAVWLDWVSRGSPRTGTGEPIIHTKQEGKTA